MPVPHLEIRIVQRSKGSSAVAGSAYQAGEKLFSEYDQKMKNYLYKKEVVYTEVMLPTNAPPGYYFSAALIFRAADFFVYVTTCNHSDMAALGGSHHE
mgnify:FL=1